MEGMIEKLKRADENIRNLDREIGAFFSQSDYPTIPDQDDESFQKAIDYHAATEVPLRFSVLAGEIVHHFRSSLDHLAWQLASPAERASHPDRIEFPIFDREPVTKDEISRYNRKVNGFSKKSKIFVEKLQPYYRGNPFKVPLSLMHHMDRFDKHRELVIIISVFNLNLPPAVIDAYTRAAQEKSKRALTDFELSVKTKSKIRK